MGVELRNRFYKSDIDLLHSAAYKAIDFHKTIANTYIGKKYIFK